MNILLTDLNSLNLEVSAITAPAPGGDGNFSRLLQQQLPRDAESFPQVTDFDEFFSALPTPAQNPDEGTVDAAVASWQDYLGQQEIRVTTDAGPWPITPVEVTDELLAGSRGRLLEVSEDSPVAGESLPASGNILPLTTADGARVTLAPAAGSPQFNAPPPASGSASPAPTFVLGQILPATSGSTRDAELAQNSAIAARSKDFAANLAQVVPKPPSGEITAPQKNSPEALLARGAPDLGEALAKPGDTRGERPVPAALSKTILAPGTEIGANAPSAETRAQALAATLARAVANPLEAELPQARDLAATAHTPAAEVKAQVPQAARAAAIADVSASGNTGEILAAVPPTSKPATDPMMVGNEQGSRSADILAPASQLQPANSVHAAATQAPSPVNPINPPTGAQPALPPLLDSMSLARTAEAAEWGDGLGERVNWMINQKQNSATIRLDPPMLGKLDVQVKIVDDATTITIQTQHAQTRELIETASVRLRDHLQENGFQNVNVDVSQRQDQQQGRAQNAVPEHTDEQQEAWREADTEERHNQHAGYSIGDGLLDTFA